MGVTRRQLISTGSPFEKKAGYSRAMAIETPDDHWCFVSGTTGYDYQTMIMPKSVTQQARNCFETIKSSLEEAGFSLTDVVRANYIVTAPEHVDDVFAVTGEYFGAIRPAATMILAGLIKPEMKIEIEVTAYRA
jgi:enamine deaminase RidA (YjgF/YER057c/UK114 family)